MIATPSTSPKNSPPLNSAPAVYHALKRHRGLGIAVFAVVAGLTLVALLVLPKTYSSEAKLFVRVGRESIGLDPTATTGQTISVYESRESEINSVLDLLESRVLLEKVVAEIGPALLLDKAAVTAADDEKAVLMLSKTIKTEHAKKSSVITVSTQARSPELAQRIAQVFVDAFLQEHLRVNRTSGSHEFFQEQQTLLSTQLKEASEKLSTAKNSIGIISVEGQRKLLQEKMNILHTAKLTGQTELAASQANIIALQKLKEQLPEKMETQNVSGFFNDAADQTKQRLFQLRLREQELLTKFTPQHPRVIALREQMAAARTILSEPNAGNRQATLALNPAYGQTELRLLQEQTMVESLQAKLDKLEQQEGDVEVSLKMLNGNEAFITQKQKQVDLLQKNFEAYSERMELARIDQELEKEQISNVNIAQPPALIAKAVGPKRRLIGLMGLMAAVFTGLLAALGKEYWVWFKPQLAPATLQAPAAATLPERHSQMAAEQRLEAVPTMRQ